MKKGLICMTAAAVIAAAPAALAMENVNYILGSNEVEINQEAGKKTVIITDVNGTIVYADLKSIGFKDNEILKIKENIPDGQYKIKLGGDSGDAVEKTFYIGFMAQGGIDVKLDKPGNDATTNNPNNTFNIGYMQTDVTGSYHSLVIKKGSKYYGMELSPVMTLNNAAVGIQFNYVADESDISEVWISGRDLETNDISAGVAKE